MTQQVKNLASPLVIGKTPTNLTPINTYFLKISNPSIVTFDDLLELKPFSITENSFQDAVSAVESIKVKLICEALVLDVSDLNFR